MLRYCEWLDCSFWRSWRAWCLGACLLILLSGSSASAGDLRELGTPHYRIHTDLDRALAEDMAVRMEAMYDQYTRRLVDFAPRGDVRFEVYLFAHRQDYAQFTGDRFPNTGGVFIPRRSLLAGFLEGQGRDGLRRTLQHEAFHQFAFTSFVEILRVWLNVGLAQIFEEGLWTGRQFMIGQVPPWRVRQLQQDMREHRLMRFQQFLALSNPDWHRDMADATTSAARYDQAWAMTHFLIFAPDEDGQPKYRARLIEMLKRIHAGQSAGDAFCGAFSDNIDGFQDRFVDYARSVQPTREASAIERQEILAEIFIACRSKDLHFDDPGSMRLFLSERGFRLPAPRGGPDADADVDSLFRDTAGRLMTREQLYFSPRGGAPLPDIVCRPMDRMRFRTIFHEEPGRIDHETLIEP